MSEGTPPVIKLFLDGAGQCAMEISVAGLAEGLWDAVSKAFQGRSPHRVVRNLRRTERSLQRSGKLRLGFFLHDPKQIEMLVVEAHRNGYPVATHALGNAAIRTILDIYERVQDRYGEPVRPFRVEHALFMTDELIATMARLKVAAVVQPAFLYQYGPVLDSLPLPRRCRVLPLRDMIDAGVLVSGSSDSPCAQEDPLLAMDCAFRRIGSDGRTLDESQSLDVDEALRLYTCNAARVMGCDRETGSLEMGKRADMVVLSGDPRAKGFERIRVTETLIEGRTAWKRGMSLAQ